MSQLKRASSFRRQKSSSSEQVWKLWFEKVYFESVCLSNLVYWSMLHLINVQSLDQFQPALGTFPPINCSDFIIETKTFEFCFSLCSKFSPSIEQFFYIYNFCSWRSWLSYSTVMELQWTREIKFQMLEIRSRGRPEPSLRFQMERQKISAKLHTFLQRYSLNYIVYFR